MGSLACRAVPSHHIPEQVGGWGKEQGGALTDGVCGHPAGLAGLASAASAQLVSRPALLVRQACSVKIAHAGGTRTAGPSTLITPTAVVAQQQQNIARLAHGSEKRPMMSSARSERVGCDRRLPVDPQAPVPPETCPRTLPAAAALLDPSRSRSMDEGRGGGGVR